MTTEFKFDEESNYWIATTSKGDSFIFNGDEETIEYIKKYSWRKRKDGYYQNYEGKRINRVVAKINDNKLFVDHINRDKSDNRIENLRVVSQLDNNRNRTAKKDITGLSSINGRYFGTIRIEGKNIKTKTKNKDEAIIDLLIIQKEFKYRHNEHLFHLIDSIDKSYTSEIINMVKCKLEKSKEKNVNTTPNIYKISECGNYYIVGCNGIDGFNSFTIDKNVKSIIEDKKWYIYKTKLNKYYVKANQGSSSVSLHRFIMGLCEDIYSEFVVDHLNGDSLDNKMSNLVITNKCGNNSNIVSSKGYHKTKNGNFRAMISEGEHNRRKNRTFAREEEAREWYLNEKEKQIKKRIEFKNKDELKKYIDSK